MLQQTQMQTVVPYFDRWMRRFPDWQTLAEADDAEVRTQWAGLGYYRRAAALRSVARAIRRDGVPASVEGWLKLPGIGPYTARAISSIGQGLPAAVVDGNVVRVLTRLRNYRRMFPSKTSAVIRVQAWADKALPSGDPGRYNQALMELGALVCTPASPQCGICPISQWCAAFAAGTASRLPRFPKALAGREQQVTRLWCVFKGRLALAPSQMVAGMWELPLGPQPEGEAVGAIRRTIGRTSYKERVYASESPPVQCTLYAREDLVRVPLTGPCLRFLKTRGWLPV
jgi:A/G-specific adenine glycosylase